MSADMINGLMEFIGSLMVLNHCRLLYKAKSVAGVSILSTVFFACWGAWNIYYYPSLDQWWSFVGGICIVIANGIWIGMLVHYSKYSMYNIDGLSYWIRNKLSFSK